MAGSDTGLVAARKGSPGVWTATTATVLVLGMLVAMVWIVGVNAVGWFWPGPVHQVRLRDGSRLMGRLVARETIPGGGERIKLKIGARELDGEDFRWVPEAAIASLETPEGAVRVERTEYGDVFGTVVSLRGLEGEPLPAGDHRVLERLLAQGRRLRRELAGLERKREKTRRPLTSVEEELAVLERSRQADSETAKQRIARLEERVESLRRELEPALASIQARMQKVRDRLERSGIEIDTGRATVRVPLGHVVALTRPNAMGVPARAWTAIERGVLFLLTGPREANTEGGIFPALFGTVLLVLLMSVAVVPLGVLTAVYMTEYAREGFLLRLATQAVHNLAGVPSIVFGMFGLGFFIYGVGGTLDRLFFADRLPTPTLGTGGVLWASLTLALLTVPVVVVATREGLLVVPREWRDASVALGATRWQTLRRVVLPAAMPGILTGLILAVSRAAGEVAPLMLTGAVKLVPALPVDGTPPFLHLERKFMHLGFHIYDVSMQSPNVEAAKPMAFATTLVLLLLVVGMNLTAIVVRRRLQKAYRGQAV